MSVESGLVVLIQELLGVVEFLHEHETTDYLLEEIEENSEE